MTATASTSAASDRTVCVAMATYNGARFLRQQLDSLLAQTLQPTELVVGDDRSSDETTQVLAAFAARAPFPVRVVVNPENLHFGENFMQTAARCGSARFLAFCDQDDVWHPTKLASCVDAMIAEDAVLCGHDAWLVDAEGQRFGRFKHIEPGVYPPLTLAPWGVFFGFTMTIRRDLLEALPAAERGPDHIDPRRRLAHDRWAYFLGTTLGRTVYLPEPLADYRQHGRNTYGAGKGGRLAKLKKLLETDTQSAALHHDICLARARQLAAIGAGPYAAAARPAAAYWQHLAAIYGERLALARSRSLLGRTAILLRLLRLKAYAPPARGGLSLRAFVKDSVSTALPLRVRSEAASS